ncbi:MULTISPECIES: nitrogen fixation protein NifX [Parafrankia]|uniref:Nitrogen fixation protein NifX n=1 Tax=Parafrankia soli TaxID=2599596 RepID=A0A1S1PFC3_9ACTN|nr:MULTISPECIES: nitrogen fixation protein NifX [Parafrankia]OHV19645.1 nitrogen fixation protein NifX [Parafrankia soli]TCJ32880.1 nitrogen fixation protein NifX [Parafrankia sp. BMG5.11]CAI7980014.1 Protein NifX [Frankia sp. Hr75.2]
MLKIAFATSDGHAVDQHFGWCRRFDVYEVGPEGFHLFETRELGPAEDDEEDKIASRLAAVVDCAILNVCDIGGTAAAKVVKARIHPMKVPVGTEIDALLAKFVGVLAGNPPPWLRKVLRAHSPQVAPAWTPTSSPSATAAPVAPARPQ